MLRNTFLNSQQGPPVTFDAPDMTDPISIAQRKMKRAIRWVDEGGRKDARQNGLVTNKSSEDLVHKKTEDLTPVEAHK